jgi:hypothetical protein
MGAPNVQAVVLGHRREVLHAGDCVVQRLGAEDDCERFRFALLVQRADAGGEASLGDALALARNRQRGPRLRLRAREPLALRSESSETRAGAGELGVEGAELGLERVGLPGKRLVRPPQLVGFGAQAVRRLGSGCRERACEGRQARKNENPETGTWRSHGAAP